MTTVKIRLFALLFITFLTLTIFHDAEADVDQDLAKLSTSLAVPLFNKNPEDPQGLILYNFAKAIAPSSDNVLLIKGSLARKRPISIPPAEVTLLEFSKKLTNRASILTTKFKRNNEVGYLVLLYLEMANSIDKKNLKIIKKRVKMKTYGFKDDLPALLEKEYSMNIISKAGERPVVKTIPILGVADRAIVKNSTNIAIKSLIDDLDSESGLKHLRLALHLNPYHYDGLLLVELLKQGIPITTCFPNVSAIKKDLFFSRSLLRAKSLFSKTQKNNKLSGHLSRLYYAFAEEVGKIETPQIIINSLKLENLGYPSELEVLISKNIEDFLPKPVKVIVTPVVKKKVVKPTKKKGRGRKK